MNKKFVAGILAFIMIIGVITASVVILNRTDGDKEPAETVETVAGDDLAEGSVDTGEPKEDVVKTINKGDPELSRCWAANSDNVVFGICFADDSEYKLKPNTKYRITWAINTQCEIDLNAYIPEVENDGVTKYAVFYHTNYVAGQGRGTSLLSTHKSVVVDNSYEFTTGDTVGEFAFFCFQVDTLNENSSSEDIIAVGKPLLNTYLTRFTLEELK